MKAKMGLRTRFLNLIRPKRARTLKIRLRQGFSGQVCLDSTASARSATVRAGNAECVPAHHRLHTSIMGASNQ